ncbi:MAG: hypothetical protein H5U21_01110 [Porphyrobacter sp.]|nr:hypothetical protein [Porphyrobacter sp.]
MTIAPKLTTQRACRIARLNRDRFNEFVASGAYPCAPETVPGRARLFDPDDILALCLFRDLSDDGFDARTAGRLACEIAACAKANPEEPAIALVYTYFSTPRAYPASTVPPPSEWDGALFAPEKTDIRKVLTYRVSKLRQMIAHDIEVERNTIGETE